MNAEAQTDRPLTCFLVAIEASGDRLGAGLMRELRAQSSRPLRFVGVGGAEMEAEGLPSLFPIHDLAVIGVTGILRKLPMLLARLRTTAAAAIAARPDVLVIIDSPTFTHRVARAVREADPTIPIVDYVCPTVWAWRPWRARAMRRYIDHVLALLPFEPDAVQRLRGPPCTYVGHSLIEEIDELRPGAAEAGSASGPPVVLVLPGSRKAELRRLLPIFGDALARVGAEVGPLELVLPTLPHFVEMLTTATASWPQRPRIVSEPAEKRAAFRRARAALAASGTVTLELALAGVPMVAAYRLSPVEYLPARIMIRVPSVILANLVIGENVVPEFLQHDCRADRLAAALLPLLRESPERARQLAGFARLDHIMGVGAGSPSAHAAAIVLATATGARCHQALQSGAVHGNHFRTKA